MQRTQFLTPPQKAQGPCTAMARSDGRDHTPFIDPSRRTNEYAPDERCEAVAGSPRKSLAECTQPPIPHPQIGLRRARACWPAQRSDLAPQPRALLSIVLEPRHEEAGGGDDTE